MKRLKRYWQFYWMFGFRNFVASLRPIRYFVLDTDPENKKVTLVLFNKGSRGVLVGDYLSIQPATLAWGFIAEYVDRSFDHGIAVMNFKYFGSPLIRRESGKMYHSTFPLHQFDVLPRAREKVG